MFDYTLTSMLAVNFSTPNVCVIPWFDLHFGTNPPLGMLII
jgi:hypothetical protein